jgi:hypothetical protein
VQSTNQLKVLVNKNYLYGFIACSKYVDVKDLKYGKTGFSEYSFLMFLNILNIKI